MQIPFFINCKESTLLQLKREEKDLSIYKKIQFQFHLITCESCRKFTKQSILINEKISELFNSTRNVNIHKLNNDSKISMQKKIEEILN